MKNVGILGHQEKKMLGFVLNAKVLIGIRKKKMEWIKICIICKKKFTSNEFIGDCCSNSCKEEKQNQLEAKQITPYLKLRFQIFNRDNFTCQYCGRTPARDGVKLEIDHQYPKNKGGENKISNYLTACQDCNIGKSDILLNKHYEMKKNGI